MLDATKHQDDKVGRLLTTIAFLTAASLALAGLAGAKAIVIPVNLGGQSPETTAPVAIALIFLIGFLIGVSIAVIQLIGSLSTPLRLPGLDPARRPSRDIKSQQAGADAVSSLIYFHEIEKNTPSEWQETWEAEAHALRARESRSLVAETHNLALRTSFKYNRTNEATAVLTWALMALSLTVTFLAIAMLDETDPLRAQSGALVQVVALDSSDMVFVGSVLATITFVWSVARMRQSRLGRDHSAPGSLVRLQYAVVLGSTLSVFVAAGLPGAVSQRWPIVYPIAVGFLAMFTAASIAWSIWAQSATTRLNTRIAALLFTIIAPFIAGALGCASYQLWISHDWKDGLPWASGWIVGAVTAWLFAKRVGAVNLPTWRDVHQRSPLPKHEGGLSSCVRCTETLRMDSGRPLKWRVLTVVSCAAAFSFAAQHFQSHLAYGWPLAATCSTLTALVGAAVLDPTFTERRERRIKSRRVEHVKVVAPVTLRTSA